MNSPFGTDPNASGDATEGLGTRLGPYEVAARIGAGGMGEVFRARDTRIGRDVALKTLPRSFATDADRLQRFEIEARATGTLNHPNLVTIFDVGVHNGTPYIVMELLEGETLRLRLAEGRLPLRKIVAYATEIASGLAAAHEKGIVHRDLKPENIFITKDERVKILDFGLAKLVQAQDSGQTDARTMERHTDPGIVVGTVGYMSPEQVRGQSVDHRSDIFSFGTILYEMLTGVRPFQGDSAADTMSAILREDPPEISDKVRLTPALDRIVRHCLEKNPASRFQSARDLAFDLQSASDVSGSSRSLARDLPAPKSQWRLLTAIAIGFLTGAIVTALIGRKNRSSGTPRRTVTQLTLQSGMERGVSLSPDGKTFLFVSDAAGNPDIYVQRVGGRNAINLTKESAATDSQPAFSPDGERIAFRSERDGGGIFVMGATGESVHRITTFGYNPTWSPDGGEIAFSTESVDLNPRSRSSTAALWIADVKSGRTRLLTKHDAVQPAWSPHGDRIAFWGLTSDAGGQRDVWTIAPRDPDPDKTIVSVTNDAAVDWNPFWSADGTYLYFGSDRDGTLNLWKVGINEKSGKTRGDPLGMDLPTQSAANFSAARSANVIAYSSISSTDRIERYALDSSNATVTGSPTIVFSGSIPMDSIALSPDGKAIVFSSSGKQEDLFVVDTDSHVLGQITNDPEKDRGPSWSPDGQRIYFYSQRGDRYETWSVQKDGSALSQVNTTPGNESAWFPQMSPDGSRILTFNETGTLIWSVGQRRFDLLPRIDQDHILMNSTWSPDGRTIVGLSVRTNDVNVSDGVALYSFATNRYQKISDDHVVPFPNPIFMPDGRYVIYALNDRIILADTDSRKRGPMTGVISGLHDYAVSRDGRFLYVQTSREEGDIWLLAETSEK